jgi:hypothetical protein
MQMRKQTLYLAVLVAACVPLQGCVVAAIGAGIAAVSYSTSQKQKAYGEYRSDTEKLNFEREKAGLSPNPVLTYKEWSKGNR